MSVDPASGPGPDEASLTPHVDPDRLVDLAEGLLDPASAAAVRAHLADCQACASDFALVTGSLDLAALLPPEPIPAEVVARVTAALEREPALGPSSPTAAPTAALAADRPSARPRWRRFRIALGGLAAAAALSAVVVGGVSVLNSSSESKSSTASGSAAAAPNATDGKAYASQGSPVDDEASAQQAALGLLAAHPLSQVPGTSMEGDQASGSFWGCLPEPQRAQVLVAAEPVSFRGQPAYLVVLRQVADPTRADVIVVPASCQSSPAAGSPSGQTSRPLAATAVTPLLRTTVRLP